jgi:hypothetical protein
MSKGPEGARHVLQQLRVQLLAAEAGAEVLPDDPIEEGGRQVGAVLVGRAAGDHDVATLAGDELADQLHRPWRRRGYRQRPAAQAEAEHRHVPRLGAVAPGRDLIREQGVVLRSSQAVWLLCAVERGDGAVRPGELAAAGLERRAAPIWRDGQDARFTLNDDVPGVRGGRGDYRHAAVLASRGPEIRGLAQDACFTKTASGK